MLGIFVVAAVLDDILARLAEFTAQGPRRCGAIPIEAVMLAHDDTDGLCVLF